MSRYSFATYAVRVRNTDPERPGYTRLDRFDGTSDLLDVLNQRMASWVVRDEEQFKIAYVEDLALDSRALQGRVLSGEYGFESDIVDVDTREITYHKAQDEANLLPFFFRFSVPRHVDECILVLQKFQQLGVRSLLEDVITSFNETYAPFRLEINPLVPEKAWATFVDNGVVQAVRFIRYEVPSDLADAWDEGEHEEEFAYTELVIRARQRHVLPILNRLRQVLRGQRDYRSIVELTNFEYHDVKVEVKLGTSRRTIDLGDLRRVRALFDITDDLVIGQDGHPTLASLSEEAAKLIREIRSSISGADTDVQED